MICSESHLLRLPNGGDRARSNPLRHGLVSVVFRVLKTSAGVEVPRSFGHILGDMRVDLIPFRILLGLERAALALPPHEHRAVSQAPSQGREKAGGGSGEAAAAGWGVFVVKGWVLMMGPGALCASARGRLLARPLGPSSSGRKACRGDAPFGFWRCGAKAGEGKYELVELVLLLPLITTESCLRGRHL